MDATAAIAVFVSTRRCALVFGLVAPACSSEPVEASGAGSSSDESTATGDATTSLTTGADSGSSTMDDGSSSTSVTGTSTTAPATTESGGSTSSGPTGGTTESSSSGTTATSDSGATSSSTGATSSTSGDTDATTSDTDATTGDTEGDDVCTETLLRTHTGVVDVHHDGDHFVTLDEDHHLVLWDTVDLSVSFEASDVGWTDIAGGTLLYRDDDGLHVVDTASGAALGDAPAELANGLARDGSYLWTASPTALSVYEPSGALRWSIADAFSGPQVLALGDALYVYAPLRSEAEHSRLSADDGSESTTAFIGVFGGWFGDVPRFWTTQGTAYRVYDTDGTQLAVELGYPLHGWGTRLVVSSAVIDVFDVDTVLTWVESTHAIHGAAILQRALDGTGSIIHLDDDPLTVEAVAPICCLDEEYLRFAYADGAWIMGGDGGYVADDLGRAVTAGEVDAIAGSTAGRMALAMHDGVLHVADIGDDCAWVELSSFVRTGRHMRMSGDGTTLLSTERWFSMFGSSREGTRVYALADGELLAEYQLGLMSDSLVGHDISDDATVWSRLHTNTGVGTYSVAGPGIAHGGSGDVVPRIAPDGQHVVISDGASSPFETWAESVTYIYDPQDFVSVLDGVAHGFVDNGHVLVAQYEADCGPGCLSLVASDIVDMNGNVVASTELPDVRDLARIDDGAAVGVEHPSGDAAIYDVVNSIVLWEAPRGSAVAVAGSDHVLVSTGARVDLVRWR